ncbi:MAG: SIMPL domain-containing protein [Sneathiella sp.]
MMKIALLPAVLLMMTSAASAAENYRHASPQDKIVFSLQKEGWVTTKSAKVVVNFDIVQQQETPSELKEQVMASLKNLASEAQWQITSSVERKDSSGLNRWFVSAEARIGEKFVSGLSDRAEKTGRKGFKVRIGRVDFSPSLDEKEQGLGQLRALVYKSALEEANRLNAVIPNRAFRVYKVEFGGLNGHQRSSPQLMRSSAKAEMAMSSDAGSGGAATTEIAVSRRQSIFATVTLSSSPVAQK